MYTLFTILIVIASVILVLLVLVQNSKGGGLAAGFSSSNQIMGVRKTTDFLEKGTWIVVVFVLLVSISSVYFNKKDVATNDSEIKDQIQDAKQAEPGVAAPAFGENPEAAPAKK